ncbi:MAG TPA: hypothetical protein VJ927_01715 [Actinomycetota bacterium]|nr:hypothetical protein [Actinomycetota bacterium]
MRRPAALLLVLVLVAGCDASTPRDRAAPETSEPPPPSDEPPSPTPGPPAVTMLPGGCAPWRGAPGLPQLTFLKDGKLLAYEPATGTVRCLEKRRAFGLAWGPRGDRVLLAGRANGAFGASFESLVPGDNRELAWSRPTGTSVVYVTHDYARLLKQEVATDRVTDISFLEAHFDVAYHPAGTHIAVAGRNERGDVGLYLATNEGTEVQRVVRGENAEYIDGLEFSHDGRKLYFRGHHADHLDLHTVRIFTGEETGDATRDLLDGRLETIYSGDRAPYFTVSPFARKTHLMFSSRCRTEDGTPAGVIVGDSQSSLDQALGGLQPVGWLPDDSVAFLAFGSHRCDEVGEGDLYSWRDGAVTLVVEDVDAAAVRVRLPAAPDPPARGQGVVA